MMATHTGILADIRLRGLQKRHQRLFITSLCRLNQYRVVPPTPGNHSSYPLLLSNLRPTIAHIGQNPINPVTPAITPIAMAT